MTKDLSDYLDDMVEYLEGHGKNAAANELAEMLAVEPLEAN